MLLSMPSQAAAEALTLQSAAESGQESASEADPGWMISFVDVLMLLLTVFVLLLAFQLQQNPEPQPAEAQVQAPVQPRAVQTQPQPAAQAILFDSEALLHDHQSAAALLAALQVATSTPQPETTPPVRASLEPLGFETYSTAALLAALQPPVAPPEVEPAQASPETGLDIPAAVRERVEVSITADSVNLIIKDEVLFDPASAVLKPDAHRVLDQIAQLLAANDHPVSVEGHTDDRPIRTARYPSNWDLSVARATEVTRFLIGRGIPDERLRAVGYADTQPLAQGSSDADRARNRRVSLIVHLRPQTDE